MASKKELSISELVETHKPKNFKYKYIFTDDSIFDQLVNEGYDVLSLDTIENDDLVQAALNAHYDEYDSSIIGKAKEPTIMNDGIIVSKKMVTKAGKKLLKFMMGFFNYGEYRYIAIKMHYEKFDILEIFVLI